MNIDKIAAQNSALKVITADELRWRYSKNIPMVLIEIENEADRKIVHDAAGSRKHADYSMLTGRFLISALQQYDSLSRFPQS